MGYNCLGTKSVRNNSNKFNSFILSNQSKGTILDSYEIDRFKNKSNSK